MAIFWWTNALKVRGYNAICFDLRVDGYRNCPVRSAGNSFNLRGNVSAKFVTFRWTKSRKTHGQHCYNIYKQLTTQSLRGSKKVGEILSFVQSLTFCIKKSSWWGRGTPGRLHGCPPRIDNGNWKMKPKMKRLQDFRIPKRESSSDIFSKVPVVYGSLDALWSPFFFETPENSHGTRKM